MNLADTLGPVATQTPFFAGFPIGVTSGTYNQTFDMLLATSYRAAFITDAGGIPQAEAALFGAIASGNAYFNIHSSAFGGGEIRGFLQLQAVPEPGTLLLGAGLGAFVRMRSRRKA